MKVTERKAIKDHVCTHCQGKISKGEKYDHFKMKEPVYFHDDPDDEQIGIQYVSEKVCLKCKDKFENWWKEGLEDWEIKTCEDGIHFPVELTKIEYAGCNAYQVPTGRHACEKCGEFLLDESEMVTA